MSADRLQQLNSQISPHFNINQIMVRANERQKTADIYLPTYLSIDVRNIVKMELGNLNAELNAVITMNIYFGDLPQELREEVWKNIKINFSRNQPINFFVEEDGAEDGGEDADEEKDQKDTIPFDPKTKCQAIRVKRVLSARISPYTFFTPFEILDLVVSFELRKVKLQWQSNEGSRSFYSFIFKFNMMRCLEEGPISSEEQLSRAINYSKTSSFGYYNLAKSFTRVEISKSHRVKPLIEMIDNMTFISRCSGISHLSKRKKTNQKKDKNKKKWSGNIKYYQYANFHIPLYKDPFVGLFIIYTPLLLLASINMTLFFSENNFNERVAGASMMTLAFVSLIPAVREQIPTGSKMTFIEIMVYIEILVTFLMLIESWIVKGKSVKDEIIIRTPFMIASLILTCLTFVMVIIKVLVFYCCTRAAFQIQDQNQPQASDEDKKLLREVNSNLEPEFEKEKWNKNLEASNYFQEKIIPRGNGRLGQADHQYFITEDLQDFDQFMRYLRNALGQKRARNFIAKNYRKEQEQQGRERQLMFEL